MRKAFKIILYIILGLVALILVAALSLNIPAVQNMVKDRALSYVNAKIDKKITLDKIQVGFPNDVVIKNLFVPDAKDDTLLSVKALKVDVNLFALIKNKLILKDIIIEDMVGNVHRTYPDTTFNFQYIVDAFTSEKKNEPDTTSSSNFVIDLDRINLTNISATYFDDVTGSYVKAKLPKFKADIQEFDLNELNFDVNSILFNQANVTYHQVEPKIKINNAEDDIDDKEESDVKLPTIKLDKLVFEESYVLYNDSLNNTYVVTDLNDIKFKDVNIVIADGKYVADLIKIHDSNFDISIQPEPKDDEVEPKDSTSNNKLMFEVDKIDIENNQVKFENKNQPNHPNKFDFQNFDARGFTLKAKDFIYSDEEIKVNLNNLLVSEQSGFQLSNLEGDIEYSSNKILANNLFIKTPETNFKADGKIKFKNISDLTNQPSNVQIDAQIKKSVVAISDINYFVSSIPKNYKNETIRLNGRVKGRMDNLRIPNFSVSGLKGTHLKLNGTVTGLPKTEAAHFDINIDKLETTKEDLKAIIPPESLPDSINLPEYINLEGTFAGTLNDLEADIDAKTDIGSAEIEAKLDRTLKGKEKYNADVKLDSFNVGYLLARDDIGKVTLTADVKGTGFKPKTADAIINGTVKEATYNNYKYEDVKLKGIMENGELDLDLTSKDPNADVDVNAIVDFNNENFGVDGTVDLAQIDFQKLGFYESELKLAGLIEMDFTSLKPDSMNGSAFITNLQLVKDARLMTFDTLKFIAVSKETRNLIKMESEVINIDVNGKYNVAYLYQAIVNIVSKYYDIGQTKDIPDQRAEIDINIDDGEVVEAFVPGLQDLRRIKFKGLIDTRKDSLKFNGDIPRIVYNDYKIKDIKIDVNNDNPDELVYKLAFDNFDSPFLQFYNSELSGKAEDNQLDFSLLLRDEEEETRYSLVGDLLSKEGNYEFVMDVDKLILNYDRWTVSEKNKIKFGKDGFWVGDFKISHDEQSITVESNSQEPQSPLEVRFDNFKLSTLTGFAEQDSSLLGGKLNGRFFVKYFEPTLNFETDIEITHLRYLKDQLGTFKLTADNYDNNIITIKSSLKDIHNVEIEGKYYTTPSAKADINLDIKKLDLQYIESLSSNQIRDGSGIIKGEFNIDGQLNQPKILGNLNFDNVRFVASQLNVPLKIDNEEILFKNDGIHFNEFIVKDTLNQEAKVIGTIYTDNYSEFDPDLRINADDFMLMNSTAADNDFVYGKVNIDVRVSLSGSLTEPKVVGDVRINENTDFFFDIPSNNPTVIEHEGVVNFVDKSLNNLAEDKRLKVDSAAQERITNLEVNANVTVDEDASITIVVDPQNGDALQIIGQADLGVQIDPSGKISVTGRYEVRDGSYNLTVGGLSRKKFDIEQGSSIVWTGAPTEANVDITAMYQTEASPIDLVVDQLAGLDQSSRNTYRQKIPFIVYLRMSGELMQPIIEFEIDMPERYRNMFNGVVWTRIQQINTNESDLNKQVLALLAFNRFFSDNPFESLAGGNMVENTVRQSASRLLTQQLNNLASDFIKGVDLNFNIDSRENFTSGEAERETDLNVALSKRLLNDRLIITVGNNFEVEGPRAGSSEAANFGSDLTMEYLLSKDGRYRLRAYRRNQTEGIIEGEIIETGVGFSMVVDYNHFKEVFENFKEAIIEKKNDLFGDEKE